jgi:hypothetical protein
VHKVLVVGGYGCGTTHVYRIVCELFKVLSIPFSNRGASADLIKQEDVFEAGSTVVIKSHDAIVGPRPQLKVFVCRRDPYDAVASLLRRYPYRYPTLLSLHTRMKVERAYHCRPDACVIDYEDFFGRDVDKVNCIATALGLRLWHDEIEQVATSLSARATKALTDVLQNADSASELRPRHVGPGYGKPGAGALLPSELRDKIGAIYAAI